MMYAFEAIDRIKSGFDWSKKERTNESLYALIDSFYAYQYTHTLTNAHHSSFILSCYNLSDHVQATQIIFWLTKWGQMLGIMLLECNNAPSYRSKIRIDMCWWVSNLKIGWAYFIFTPKKNIFSTLCASLFVTRIKRRTVDEKQSKM